MKKFLVSLLMVGFLFAAVPSKAEAGSFRDVVENIGSYLFKPVDCIGGFLAAVGQDAVEAVQCILTNVNRNPVNLEPVLSAPEHAVEAHENHSVTTE